MKSTSMVKSLDRIIKSVQVALNAKTQMMQSPGTNSAKVAMQRYEKHIGIVNAEYELLRAAITSKEQEIES